MPNKPRILNPKPLNPKTLSTSNPENPYETL